MHAQGQAVAGAVDIRHHLFKITGAVPDNMQDRAKHLGIESLDGIYFKSTGWEKITIQVRRHGGPGNQPALCFF